MNKNDVLIRARHIIETDLMSEDDFSCNQGKYCPYCAIGQAKTELDDEVSGGISDKELLIQSVFGFKSIKSDAPLEEARNLISVSPPFFKESSLLILSQALSA